MADINALKHALNNNLLQYILTYPLFLISHYLPKNRSLWIFGSWGGVQFNDNSKYMFEHVNKYCPDIRAVWLTKNNDTMQRLRAEGYECYHMYSLRGILAALRAGAAFLSRVKAEDLPIFLSPAKTRIIQLWHGTPLKKLGRDSKVNRGLRKSRTAKAREWLRRHLFPQSGNPCAAFIVSSKEVGEIIESAYGDAIINGSVQVTGYPRNDALFGVNDTSIQGGMRRGIYLPTFRDAARDASNLFQKYGFDIDIIERHFAENNIELHIKLHPESVLPEEFRQKLLSGKHVKLVEFKDIYAELGKYDFLVTDYSSVFFDYLLLDRPIIFSPFDLDDYLAMRGMYFEYDEITPGIRALNWCEVVEAIDRSLESPGEYSDARFAVNRRLNTQCDDQSCRRVTEMTRSLLH